MTARELCHALAQPLMAAQGSLELALQMREGEPGRAELFKDALAALERAGELTRQLNDIFAAE